MNFVLELFTLYIYVYIYMHKILSIGFLSIGLPRLFGHFLIFQGGMDTHTTGSSLQSHWHPRSSHGRCQPGPARLGRPRYTGLRL